MSRIQHVFKRGSVYWWRRRLPIGSGAHDYLRVEVSLHTKSQRQAKTVSAEITRMSEALLPKMRHGMISADDAKKILTKVALAHSAKLDAVAATEIAYGTDPDSARMMDTAAGWAYRLFASHGATARIGDHELRDMRFAGLDDITIAHVANAIDDLREGGAYPPQIEKITALMDEFGIDVTPANFKQAEQIYLRGLSAALLNTGRRWSGIRLDDDALLQNALMAEANAPLARPRVSDRLDDARESPAPSRLVPATSSENATARSLKAAISAQDARSEDNDDDDLIDDEDDGSVESEAEDADYRSLVEIVEEAARINVKSEDWVQHTARQHLNLAKLFVRFLKHDNPRRVRQSDIAQFRSFLIGLPKTYGKSPKDHELPIEALVERAKTLPPEQVGLSKSTMNRHMTQIGNIADICKHAGYPFGNFEGVAGLRSKKKGRGNERPKFETQELETLCKLPVWNGCLGERQRLDVGPHVIHDSSYWVPLIGMYTGARREEICALLVSEIETIDGEMPCIHFKRNELRKLKTEVSERRVPIHAELLRLGFLDYVEAVRALGHKALFPELIAVAANTPLGDVFYDDWVQLRDAALPDARKEGKVFHSLRHWCNNEMKQALVFSEIRRDILGHANSDMNEGRYSSVARLKVMEEALAKLPLPTAGLKPYPIRLRRQVIDNIPRATKPPRRRS